MTGREAKEFLVAQIVSEANRQATPLDHVEQKMLYFTETAWMPIDTWEASVEFARSYNQDAYELKIANLIQLAREYDPSSKRQWVHAISALDREDHYLSVMIHYDSLGSVFPKIRPPHDRLRLLLTAVLAVVLLLAAVALYSHFTDR